MRHFRTLLLSLMACLWAVGGMSRVAFLFSDHDHHRQTVQFAQDGVTVVLHHEHHDHDTQVDSDHVRHEHHPDHVVKLPHDKNTSALSSLRQVQPVKFIALMPPFPESAVSSFTFTQHAIPPQPPPLSRSNTVYLRSTSVLLV